jgi:hypothetical protein
MKGNSTTGSDPHQGSALQRHGRGRVARRTETVCESGDVTFFAILLHLITADEKIRVRALW